MTGVRFWETLTTLTLYVSICLVGVIVSYSWFPLSCQTTMRLSGQRGHVALWQQQQWMLLFAIVARLNFTNPIKPHMMVDLCGMPKSLEHSLCSRQWLPARWFQFCWNDETTLETYKLGTICPPFPQQTCEARLDVQWCSFSCTVNHLWVEKVGTNGKKGLTSQSKNAKHWGHTRHTQNLRPLQVQRRSWRDTRLRDALKKNQPVGNQSVYMWVCVHKELLHVNPFQSVSLLTMDCRMPHNYSPLFSYVLVSLIYDVMLDIDLLMDLDLRKVSQNYSRDTPFWNGGWLKKRFFVGCFLFGWDHQLLLFKPHILPHSPPVPLFTKLRAGWNGWSLY